MSEVTIAIDEETLRRARLRASRQGTSVDALLRDFLEAFAGTAQRRRRAMTALIELSRASESRRGGRAWTRDELHDR